VRVYVETNFLLEISFYQEEAAACEELLAMASTGDIELAIPAYCVIEAADTRRRRSAEVQTFSEQYKRPGHLTRLPWLDRAVHDFRHEILKTLSSTGQRLETLGEQLATAASILPLEGSIALATGGLCDELTLHPPDGAVLATVVAAAQRHDRDSIFLNRNVSDFDTPMVRERLASVKCRLIRSFRGGLDLVRRSQGTPPDA